MRFLNRFIVVVFLVGALEFSASATDYSNCNLFMDNTHVSIQPDGTILKKNIADSRTIDDKGNVYTDDGTKQNHKKAQEQVVVKRWGHVNGGDSNYEEYVIFSYDPNGKVIGIQSLGKWDDPNAYSEGTELQFSFVNDKCQIEKATSYTTLGNARVRDRDYFLADGPTCLKLNQFYQKNPDLSSCGPLKRLSGDWSHGQIATPENVTVNFFNSDQVSAATISKIAEDCTNPANVSKLNKAVSLDSYKMKDWEDQYLPLKKAADMALSCSHYYNFAHQPSPSTPQSNGSQTKAPISAHQRTISGT